MFFVFAVLCSTTFAARSPLKVCLVSGSAEYNSDESLSVFQEYLETNYNAVCTRVFGKDKGNDLPGIEALDTVDVMVLYTRRFTLPADQLARVRKFVDSGKPIVGIRTASHAFENWQPDVKTFDREILGGSYGGHYGTDAVARVELKITDHAILKDILPFTTTGKLYKNPQLAPDVTVLATASTAEYTEPVAWTRTRGRRLFYISLGVPEDFKLEPFRQMLAQAVFWAANRPVERKAPAGKVRKIVLIGDKPDGHAKGTHEYAKGVRLLQHCLETSPNVRGIKTEAHVEGWPENPSTLDDADTILLYTTGSDKGKHPLLLGDRLEQLGRAMKRGAGLVCLHYTLYMPNARGGPEFLEWIGGYNDYENNYSTHRVIEKDPPRATPVGRGHPICRGWKAYSTRNEFYIQQRFRPRDPRRVPILTTRLPVENPTLQVIAWAVEREDGGRGFGFTGGHFHSNWYVEDFRKMVLNAILWTAKMDVPKEGVISTPPPVETE